MERKKKGRFPLPRAMSHDPVVKRTMHFVPRPASLQPKGWTLGLSAGCGPPEAITDSRPRSENLTTFRVVRISRPLT